jgi:hypothetical protein
VLLRFEARLFAAFWLAKTPAGIEIIIAIEKPSAIITSNARIFRLEIFRIALLIIPTYSTYIKVNNKFTTKKRLEGVSNKLGSYWAYGIIHFSNLFLVAYPVNPN